MAFAVLPVGSKYNVKFVDFELTGDKALDGETKESEANQD